MKTNLTSITLVLIFVIFAVLLITVPGCSAAGDLFAERMAEIAVQQAVVSGVRNQIEGQRGVTVNTGNPSSGYALPSNVPQRIEPSIIIHKWKDYNGDEEFTMDESLGEMKDFININNAGMWIETNYGSTLISYTLLGSNDNVISKIDSEEGGCAIFQGKLP